ncbi:MAG: DUF554 domain-containing protein [Firmicutes bacterium]|nr:DUF554 domain-containing protein [Bacillota bacterium]
MIFTGTLVNGIAIVVCAVAGTFFIRNIPERFREIIMKALALSTIFVGISGALGTENVIVLIVSLVAGSIIGEALDIDGWMNRLGKYAEKKLGFGEGNFSKGFVTASILYCTGAMAIVGAMNSGILLDHSTLFAKSILDGVIGVIFAGAMGIGVAFSAIPTMLYEGLIAFAAYFAGDFMPPEMITEMGAAGSLIISAIGINFLEIGSMKPIKVANMIPAAFIPCIWFPIAGLFH